MELACREQGDRLLKPGEYNRLRQRLRLVASRHDLATVIACAFDRRARMLPFYDVSKQIAPAGGRAIGSALVDAGFQSAKTRIVLQQWNPNFRPALARLDGRIPDLLLVSGMQVHSAAYEFLLRDASRIDIAHRPLIIAGGSKAIYEPWDAFSAAPADPWGADLAVRGEEFVLLSLLEVVLSFRAAGEPLRSAFLRARDASALEQIPGLVYPVASAGPSGLPDQLVDTGVQRLLGDLDELPDAVPGFALLERPGRAPTLADQPLSADKVAAYCPTATVTITSGCGFSCPYCPIPAYNQHLLRGKSASRVVDEMKRLYERYRFDFFFGADDNFFSDETRAGEILEQFARAQVRGQPLREHIGWGTEVTIHGTLRMADHLHLARDAGLLALWIGVEDMTATLVRKGQGVGRTLDAMALLRKHSILPIPMMMHHDGQPLFGRRGNYGLLNQVHLLAKAGAIDMQVLIIGPSPGSRDYDQTFTSGQAIDSASGRKVQPFMMDGNYAVASASPNPWRLQVNVMAALVFFYNPLRLVESLFRPKAGQRLWSAMAQLLGMRGLLHSLPRMLGWAIRLMCGRITRRWRPPASRLPVRTMAGTCRSLAGATVNPLPPRPS